MTTMRFQDLPRATREREIKKARAEEKARGTQREAKEAIRARRIQGVKRRVLEGPEADLARGPEELPGLPWPPTANHYWVPGCGGNPHARRRSGRGIAYAEAVRKILWDAGRREADRWWGNVYLKIGALPPDRRKRDVDNILKCLLDSIERSRVVFFGDFQIGNLHVERGAPVRAGLVMIELGRWVEEGEGSFIPSMRERLVEGLPSLVA